jgi:DtxR family Mn-dependent transcriptional regulator
MPAPSLSPSVEDYLKAIYGLCEGGDPASTSSIAEALQVQPASVTGMVKRLAGSGLLEHVPYRGVRLTAKGAREALRVVRRHRVIESFLCEHLGYAWDDVHEEAERLEHAASEELVERMAAALSSPGHDPHGAPIPTRSGHIEVTDLATLADALPGTSVRIRAVRDEDPERLRSMKAAGLVPGATLRVDPGPPEERSTAVVVDGEGGETFSVDHEMARHIYVVPSED